MEIYIKLFEVLSPVFFIVGIGYFLGKQKSDIDTTFITNYSANFGAPALFIFAITSRKRIQANRRFRSVLLHVAFPSINIQIS